MSVRPAPAELAITFLYYRDPAAAWLFYERVPGPALAIGQGWCRIYRIARAAHLGLVDAARGMHRAADPKPVQLCLRIPDVDARHDWAGAQGVPAPSQAADNAALGIRAFTFDDPEGYQIEIQSPTRPGA